MITIIKNGKFTGTQYSKEQFTEEVKDFHKDDLWIEKPAFTISLNEDDIIDFGEPTVEELGEAYSAKILDKIKVKEEGLVRPMRELLVSTSTSEAKTFAQSKINAIELEIQRLRGELNGNI